ncbi:MAG: threonine ammonia-lyase [Terriglobales bacterium]
MSSVAAGAVSAADIAAAAERIAPRIHRTPVLRSRSLDQAAGAEVYLKAENLQRGGAFKFRGAINRMLQLTGAERQRGVVAYSSGNHAQAVALAARDLGITADLVMPADAPKSKLAAVRDFGGTVHTYDRATQQREELAAQLVRDHGRVLVPPFDDPRVLAGQGTAALELLADVPDLDALAAPIGGGGLLSGSAIAAHSHSAQIAIYGVEPETAADVKLSLENGRITSITDNPTIADGLRTIQPGELTFPILQHHLTAVLTVSDAEIIAAMCLLLLRVKTLAEPSGAAALAAVIAGKLPRGHRKIGVILSGGNCDPEALARYLV